MMYLVTIFISTTFVNYNIQAKRNKNNGKKKSPLDNVASYEFIPWVLGQCANLAEARRLLVKLNLVDIAFSKELTPPPLHWIISDSEGSLTVGFVKEGLKVYENSAGALIETEAKVLRGRL